MWHKNKSASSLICLPWFPIVLLAACGPQSLIALPRLNCAAAVKLFRPQEKIRAGCENACVCCNSIISSNKCVPGARILQHSVGKFPADSSSVPESEKIELTEYLHSPRVHLGAKNSVLAFLAPKSAFFVFPLSAGAEFRRINQTEQKLIQH